VKPRNLLFICSRNQWRSPTAEQVFGRRADLRTRSAGTSPNARRTVTPADLRWADVILVMEPKHRRMLLAKFGRPLVRKTVHVLHVPDDYRYMDADLIELLEDAVGRVLDGDASRADPGR
jgi:predicted protein tyrosine phosphatase